jgi:hypothetical protein
MAQTELINHATHNDSLADILERVLNTGVVIAGDIRIKLCDVELLSIQIRLLICSVEKAKELGISWWWQQSQQPLPAAAPVVNAAVGANAALAVDGSQPFSAEEYQQFREFQRYRKSMQTQEAAVSV